MKRRNVAQAIAVLTGGAALTGRSVMADESCSTMAGIVYSKSMQGKWKGKDGSHAPKVTLNGNQITVETQHGMSSSHYIVRHTLVTADGTVVGEKNFSGTDKKAYSVFTLPAGTKGKVTATSFCNLHDLWITELIV